MCSVVLFFMICYFFFFKQKTAYEMRISDWSSDVCSSDLPRRNFASLQYSCRVAQVGQARVGARADEGAVDRDVLKRSVRRKVHISHRADRVGAAVGGQVFGTGNRSGGRERLGGAGSPAPPERTGDAAGRARHLQKSGRTP